MIFPLYLVRQSLNKEYNSLCHHSEGHLQLAPHSDQLGLYGFKSTKETRLSGDAVMNALLLVRDLSDITADIQ